MMKDISSVVIEAFSEMGIDIAEEDLALPIDLDDKGKAVSEKN